jgi:hypothetical protein
MRRRARRRAADLFWKLVVLLALVCIATAWLLDQARER